MGSVGKNPSLLAEFQQTLLPEDVQAKYIAFLESKVSSLTAELEEAQAENANLHALIGQMQNEKEQEGQQENE
ncbi:hypothetical protein D3C77_684650 [compost metagenome]